MARAAAARKPPRIVVALSDLLESHAKGQAGPAREVWPGLKVLFTSGYTDDAIAHQGVLDPGTRFVTVHSPLVP